MSDESTTVRTLRDAIAQFVAERNWQPYHDPKNLAMSISIEAAELMEHFQWLRSEQLAAIRQSEADMRQIREELADILCYALSFANALDIDVADAVRDKIAKNAQKYPADQFKGRYR